MNLRRNMCYGVRMIEMCDTKFGKYFFDKTMHFEPKKYNSSVLLELEKSIIIDV